MTHLATLLLVLLSDETYPTCWVFGILNPNQVNHCKFILVFVIFEAIACRCAWYYSRVKRQREGESVVIPPPPVASLIQRPIRITWNRAVVREREKRGCCCSSCWWRWSRDDGRYLSKCPRRKKCAKALSDLKTILFSIFQMLVFNEVMKKIERISIKKSFFGLFLFFE